MQADPHEVLQRVFGYPYFRPGQADVVQAVLAEQDVLALLPTGGGKSLCYQVPALCMPGLCIVVSPLVALMRDQTERLRSRGIAAFALHAGQPAHEQGRIFEHCLHPAEGAAPVKFLYLSPERLQSEIVRERLSLMPVCLLAIDEAHCISQWGHDFRPSYRALGTLRTLWQRPVPCLALTASATPAVVADIQAQLGFGNNAATFSQSFARPNLSFSARYAEDKTGKLLDILAKVPGTALVYVRSRKLAQQVALALKQAKMSADFIHAGLPHAARAQRQDRWMAGRTRIMVATTAFGMGIDKADVRLVAHYGLPESPESYYQEAGRAGRDGQRSYAVLLYGPLDIEVALGRVADAYPPDDFLRRVYQALCHRAQVAVGGGALQSFDFDLDAFQGAFNLPGRALVGALRRLEDAGFIAQTDSYRAQGHVQFLWPYEKIYEHQMLNRMAEPLLKTLLRLYGGGLFADGAAVSEYALGMQLGADAASISRQLQGLAQQGLLAYTLPTEHPQITFLTERYPPEDLPLRAERLQERKAQDLARAHAIISLATDTSACRMVRLVGYFGQTLAQTCGICDVCLQKKKGAGQSHMQALDIEKKLLAQLPPGADSTVYALLRALPDAPAPLVLEALRTLAAAGKIALRDGRVYGQG